ncbi:MAG: lamin tail domain-containing protein, partial [Bacteroidia bacterium]|nr:lamin tail domain-containing protein [Bacteroidia bacterium]
GNNCQLHFKTNRYEPFYKVQMFDDGLHHDGLSADGQFGASIPPQAPATTVFYYIYADNPDAGKFSPERAEYEYHSYQVQGIVLNQNDLVINELLASNSTVHSDPNNEYDDWIELYNNTMSDIPLNGMYLSDDSLEPYKWAFPDTFINGYDFLIIWADNDLEQPSLHAGFKLSGSGEQLYLYNSNGDLLDSVIFPQQVTDITYGRYPNGTGSFQSLIPTFQANNMPLAVSERNKGEHIFIYPNPANKIVFLKFTNVQQNNYIELYDMLYRKISEYKIDGLAPTLCIPASNLENGVYFIKGGNFTAKLIIQR